MLFAASSSVLPSSFGKPPRPSRTSITILVSVGTDSSRINSRFKAVSSSFLVPVRSRQSTKVPLYNPRQTKREPQRGEMMKIETVDLNFHGHRARNSVFFAA